MTNFTQNKNSNNHKAKHAGVVRRVLATAVDAIIAGLAVAPINLIFFVCKQESFISADLLKTLKNMHLTTALLTHLFLFLYFTLQYNSKHQATIGMRLLKLKITDENYHKPTFQNLCIRYGAYALPSLFSILFPPIVKDSIYSLVNIINILMIALTEKNQTYYDIASKTVILDLSSYPKD